MLGWLGWLIPLLLQLIGLIVISILLLILYRVKVPAKPAARLMQPHWQQDMVYLCQFPLCPSVRTISPFALKLETWLRLAGVKYENVYTLKFNPKTKQIPYVELNGEVIADSGLIIERLTNQFGLDPDSELDGADRALGRAVTAMVEHHTAQTGFHYRYGHHMASFLHVLKLEEFFPSPSATRMWGRFQPYTTRFRNFLQGLGRLENCQIWEMANRDLAALSALLGEKEYFFGSEPTLLDCMVFGHLAQFLYIDIGFPQKTFLESNCRNLVALVEKMKQRFYPQWDEEIVVAKKRLRCDFQ